MTRPRSSNSARQSNRGGELGDLRGVELLLVGQRVWHGAFSPDESLLFVTNGVSNDVSVIDVAKQEVIKSMQVGRLPWGVVVTPQ